jgi:hypothetical protein
MSSATSTDLGQPQGSTPSGVPGPEASQPHADNRLQPWQFFVLAALIAATAVTFIARGQGPTAVILLSVLMGATAFAGLAALRAVLPLVSSDDPRPQTLGHRVRATLEREKVLALRAIKELEFDRAMGKVADEDFREMTTRLRRRAAGLIRRLDAGAGYRERIEQDLVKRLGDKAPAGPKASDTQTRACAKCSTGNDADARFCKQCGSALT